MLKGKSGEKISLCMEPNGHLLSLGASGSGKSYFIYRRLEEIWKAGTGSRRYAVLDYSNSFTPKEIKKAGFSLDDQIFYIDLTEKNILCLSEMSVMKGLAECCRVCCCVFLKLGHISKRKYC